MVRSYSNVGFQLGRETTKGVAAPANRRLMGLTGDPSPAFETTQHRASGYKVPVVNTVTSEATETDYEGPIDYNAIVYPLSSLFGATTPEADPGAATAFVWEWSFTGKGAVDPVTFTAEHGDAERAVRYNHAAFNSVELSIERTGDNTMSGSIIGRAMEEGVALTPDPVEIPIMPVNGDHWDVFADNAAETLGDTKLLAVYEAGLSFSDMFEQEYTLNSSNRSFNSLYDAEEPTFEWTMMLGADAVAEAYLTNLRDSKPKFIRLRATGPEIADGVNHSIEVDMSVFVTDVDSYQSNDGIYVLPLTFTLAYDPEWGKAMEIRVVNSLAAL